MWPFFDFSTWKFYIFHRPVHFLSICLCFEKEENSIEQYFDDATKTAFPRITMSFSDSVEALPLKNSFILKAKQYLENKWTVWNVELFTQYLQAYFGLWEWGYEMKENES